MNTGRYRALSQGFEPGHDPYDTTRPSNRPTHRATLFGQDLLEFLADEAVLSIADEDIRREVGVAPHAHYPTGPSAIAEAAHGAYWTETDRKEFKP